jgi:GNAT superfamily N-acetyltransferase
MIKIAQVPAHTVWPIRHQVMYPNENIDSIQLAEDDQGIHLALFADDELVSVMSLFIQGHELQFRKFATRSTYQGKGYGSQLLEYMIQYARAEKMHRIWCNARRSAAGFYSKFGFRETAEHFHKKQIEYVIMELTNHS